jgi:hypothetical protein
LFECSECFGEYRQALAQSRLAPDKISWKNGPVLIMALKLSAAATLILILSSLFFVGRLGWLKPAPEAGAGSVARSAPSDATAGAAGEPAPSPTATPIMTAVAKPTVERRAAGRAWRSSSILRPRESIAETIDVDLDNYQVFRRVPRVRSADVNEEQPGKEGAETPGASDEAPPVEKIIHLPATRAKLVLRLPETGVPGKYNVSLINAFGRPLLSSTAFSPDGAKLQLTLDLRRVPPKKYRLLLWRKGEAPAFYDVIIGGR